MSGISSKAAGKLENKYKYNDGTELNSSFDISLYETDFRLYDPQIGRFVQSDELAEVFDDWSPYTFANDNPILLNDPTGLAGDTAWKPLPEVVLTSTIKKSAASSGGSNMINGPGHGIRKNTSNNFEELTTQPYINYTQTRSDQWDPQMTKVSASDIKESALLFVPWGRVVKGAGWFYRLRKVEQIVIATGQRHHLLSTKIMRVLNSHPSLKGLFNRDNPDFIYQALDAAAHKGYQTWHRTYDATVVQWLESNLSATPAQFTKYLNDLYQQPWLKNIIPNVKL